MSNRGRSTTGEAAVPYYRGTEVQEAVKHLRLTATRFLSDRASLTDIEQAMVLLRQAASVKPAVPALRVLDEYSVTVTVDVSATSKEKALAGVRACLGPSAARITRIAAKER